MSADPAPTTFAARLQALRRRIADTGRDPDGVEIVAVSKRFGVEDVATALEAGARLLGENYGRELVDKAEALAATRPDLAPRARWHYIGAIQRRTVRALAPHVACWQTVARAVEGEAIAAAAPGARVLVQVDTTGRAGRNGVPPGGAPALVALLRDLGLEVTGLMTMGPPGAPELARPGFARVAALAAALGLPDASMGMSADLEIALGAGSTMVRVGEALFGPRPGRSER